jgi:hypothetical protein
MKLVRKIACLILIISLSITATTVSFADEILFRGLAWGINPKAANNAIVEMKPALHKLMQASFLRYPSRAFESVLDSSKNYLLGNYDYFTQNDVLLRAGAVFDETHQATIGGYKLDTMFLCFSYEIIDGQINYDEDKSHLAVAEYNFDIIDGDAAAKNLTEKLTNLYGEGKNYCFTTGQCDFLK